MTDPVPFCERCGRPGATLSGMHPGDEGLVHWTLYRCGHMHTRIVLDEELDALPTTPSVPERVAL